MSLISCSSQNEEVSFHWDENKIEFIEIKIGIDGTVKYKKITKQEDIKEFIEYFKVKKFIKSKSQKDENGWIFYISIHGEEHNIQVTTNRVRIDGIWYDEENVYTSFKIYYNHARYEEKTYK